MTKYIIKSYKGWAINANSTEGHGLLGKFWWFNGWPKDIPNHMQGHVTAVFKTRKDAREALRGVRRSFPAARVERVSVDITIER